MTNNDIIQALKLCLTRTECCFGCVMLGNEVANADECQVKLAEDAIALINSQDAKIEELNGVISNMTKSNNEIKIDAIEQFARMLEHKLVQMCRDEDAYVPYPFTFIDELLKEYKEQMTP